MAKDPGETRSVMGRAPEASLDRARNLLRVGRYGEVRTFLARILLSHPDDELAWHMLSFALEDPDQQAYALRRVLEINPGNRAARSQLSRLLEPAAPPAERPARPTAGLPEVARPAMPRPATPRPEAVTVPVAPSLAERGPSNSLRIAKYIGVRGFILLITLAVGLFLSIVLLNYGGYIDEIFEDQVRQAMLGMAMGMRGTPPGEAQTIIQEAGESMRESLGLNDPFLLRCGRWWIRGFTLRLGEAERLETADTRDSSVRAIILERLPNSLLLLGAGNLVLFVASLFLALALSRRHGSLVDRLIIGLSPLSAAPTWVHGIILTIIFAAGLGWLPYGGMLDEAPPDVPLGYAWVVAKHMVLPVAAIFLATFFQSVYSWRTYFLLHSREDYVEMAVAKGLPNRMLERRYILRPTLPYIVTSFALVLLTSWQGLLILEVFFHWPGIGQLFIEGIRRLDRPVLVGLIAVFAYLLALTVFLLDFFYVLVDPRVKIGSRGSRGRAVRRRRWAELRDWIPHLPTGDSLRRRARGVWRSLAGLPAGLAHGLGQVAAGLRTTLREVARYPSATLGLVLILGLVGMSIYTVVAIPIDEAIDAWRGARPDWYVSPRYAQPTWVNLFRKVDLPPTIIMSSSDGTATKSVEAITDEMTRIRFLFPFDYEYGALPQDLIVLLNTEYTVKRPHLVFTWVTPDGRETEIASFSQPTSEHTYYLTGDERFASKLKGQEPLGVLFYAPGTEDNTVLQGRYSLRVDGYVFEEDADLDALFVLSGKVYGLAGTDDKRRDLMIPLLWGAPVALAFGMIGAVGTTLASMIIAAVGTWFGGWVDELVQRLTEVNMVLPALPIAIMVYLAYSKSIWVILAVMVLLSIFGSSVKNYRAAFLQVKESSYVEAARVYGASDRRIILRYLVPRIVPVMIPQLVALIPGYVFLEATLAFLGVVDPLLPTWGKVVYDALTGGTYAGHYYWVLEPLTLLLLTGLSFALLSFALERVLEPRLRES